MFCFLYSCNVVLVCLSLGAGGAHWNYQQEGRGGPHHWTGVCQDGESQSPINIVSAEHVSLPEWIFTGYDKTIQSIQLTNNGHSIKFSSSAEKMPTVAGGDLPGHFVFAQGHFHWGNSSYAGSEHLIGGKSFPLELHLVHFNSKYVTIGESLKHADGLTVIGVIHEVSERDNPNLDPIIESLEHIKNANDHVDLRTGLSLESLFPTQSSAFYRYSGSLTTPGCNEIVTWSVLHHHQTVSERQLERLRSVLDSEGHPMGNNYRPVLPLHGRRVTVTGLQPTVVITHNVVQGKKNVDTGASHWNYQKGTHAAPDHWQGVCQSGKAQSPINIKTAEHVSLPEWRFTGYDRTLQSIRLTNNGHSVKFSSSAEKMPTVAGGDLTGHFVFAQGHFHWGNYSHAGSEHLIGGKSFPLELHLVHFNSKYMTIGESLKHADGLAVIGVMYEVAERDNPHLDPFIESLEHIKNVKDHVDLMPGFSLASLMPTQSSAFYRYSGSLTTPGCNEIVTWSVLHHPQSVSERQLERLRSVLDSDGHPMGNNYRPVVPIHGRRVTVTGLEPTLVITQNKVKEKVENMNTLGYFNMVPGWAVVLIALAVGLNVGCLVLIMARRSGGHGRVPTEEF